MKDKPLVIDGLKFFAWGGIIFGAFGFFLFLASNRIAPAFSSLFAGMFNLVFLLAIDARRNYSYPL